VIGLTIRIGKAVYGTIKIIQDLIEEGQNVLILGRPGVGKTTMLREAARILAESKRVVIVDTSNEIGGDGDVPHPAVGRSRRMQVATPSLQHEVMIEAVENHNPEVIIIDEIGRELEAAAARTIAERGVQLIGTAHGNTLENLLLNPTLSDLIGGIESVTLSDEEARRRGTQKSVLERRSPPTFDILVEIQERNVVNVQKDVSAAVDAHLRGYPMPPEVRTRHTDGEIRIEKMSPMKAVALPGSHGKSGPRRMLNGGNGQHQDNGNHVVDVAPVEKPSSLKIKNAKKLQPVYVYPYGVARNRLEYSAIRLKVPFFLVKEIKDADVMVTLKTYYQKRQHMIIEAERRGMPVYVLRSNTTSQIDQFMLNLFRLGTDDLQDASLDEVLELTRSAILNAKAGKDRIELPPAASYVRKLQHEMVREANLSSESFGKDPNRRVVIYRG
jgi:nucleoside-triphosphatase THEP1